MDGYKNNFVDLCALDTCIKFGARCLDFEIYSYNGEICNGGNPNPPPPCCGI